MTVTERHRDGGSTGRHRPSASGPPASPPGSRSPGSPTWPSSSTTGRRPPRPASSPPTGSRPRRCCGASRSWPAARVRAVVLNSGGANACTGPAGFQDTHQTAEHLAALLGIGAGEVAVCSTGLIGERLPLDKLLAGVTAATGAGRSRTAGWPQPTRSGPPTRCRRPAPCSRHRLPDRRHGQGRGDAGPGAGHHAGGADHRRRPARRPPWTTRCARPCGRPSTGSTPTAACPPTTRCCCWPAARAAATPDPAEFTALLTAACADLATQMQADAEGASKAITIEVTGAASEADAVEVGRAIARCNLLKCAIHGEDPNWGRVLAAVGTTSAAFEPDQLSVAINGVWVCKAGAPGRGQVGGRPAAARGHHHGRARGRPARGDDQDDRPHRRSTCTRTRRTRHDKHVRPGTGPLPRRPP